MAAVRRRGLTRRHAVIAVETALTESRLRMYDNRNNPASLALPHEAVGSDHGRVGLFQQQVGGAKNSTADWGTTAQLMDAAISTGNFLDALVRHDLDASTDWQVAQSVQHSAFADGRNYRANYAEAQTIVDDLWDDATDTADDVAAKVATVPTVPTPSGGTGDYVVSAGDTLFAIAARFGFTWRDLADLNHLPDPDLIRPGQHLQVRGRGRAGFVIASAGPDDHVHGASG